MFWPYLPKKALVHSYSSLNRAAASPVFIFSDVSPIFTDPCYILKSLKNVKMSVSLALNGTPRIFKARIASGFTISNIRIETKLTFLEVD